METLQQAWEYALDPANDLLGVIVTHLQLSGVSLLLAALIGVPLGILISRYTLLAQALINVVGILRVIPSIAVLFLLYPLLGIGFWAPVVALTILAVPPLLINTNAGMRGVNPAIVEAGRGMGMSAWQLLGKVQIPLALPVMLAGLRIATIEIIASATLAVFIGGGGLGVFVYAGLTLNRNYIMLVGAVPVAIIALVAELALSYIQRRAAPRHAS